jgi:hypothetical protein
MTRFLHRSIALISLLFALLICAGCFRLDMEIAVNPDGSGTLGFGLGLESGVRALVAASEGEDLLDLESILEGQRLPSSVAIHSWVDGDTEWQQARMPFDTLDELHTRVSTFGELFESFSITKRHGLLKDYYDLEATLVPLSAAMELSEEDLWSSSMVEVSLSVTLPGKVTRHNGRVAGAGASNTLSWTVSTNRPTAVYASSELVNSGRVYGLVAAGVVLLVGFGLILVALAMLVSKHRSS